MQEMIHLIHTNDLHSHFENWPKIRRFIKRRQEIYQKKGEEFITVDLGDFMDRCHILTDATDGLANIEIMNQVPYDYITIGNNEGLTNSKSTLEQLYDKSTATVLLANLIDKSTEELPNFVKPYHIFETKLGTKIGFIGLTTPMNLTYHPFGWHAIDPIICLEKWLPQIKAESDIIIVLSHLGLPEDKRIAEMFSIIDIIIGSHTHHLLENGLMWNSCLLVAAGRFGEYVGEVDLFINQQSLIKKVAKTVTVADFEKNDDDRDEIHDYQKEGELLLQKQIMGNLPISFQKETSLMDMTLKAMRNYAKVDVAFLNTGIILTDLNKGIVTKKDLHECLPHPMNLIKVTLKGKDVKRLVYEIERLRDYLYQHKIVGMKFRGNFFGEMCYDGLTYCDETKEVTWCQKQIEDESYYDLVTVDHLSFLPFFPTIEIAGKVTIMSPEFLRTILGNYIQKKFP